MRGGRLRHCLALTCAALTLPWGPALAEDNLEYAVKAAYLTKFIPFIEWPDQAPGATPGTPFTICVLGPDPFGAALDHAVAGQKIGDRPLIVRRLQAFDPAVPCPMVFLAGADGNDTLEALKGKPVVTVTDSGQRAHGVISFVLADNHVRFDIDDAAAARGGLKISSKLLELARAVHRREGPP